MLTHLKTIIKKGLSSVRPEPKHQWLYLARYAKKHGLRKPILFLSFDCDTDLDIPAAETLAYSLQKKGIQSTFAVPGAQLLKGRSVFQAMAKDGFEFINHGALPHTQWDGTKYIPATFYDAMSLHEVEADIREGDKIVREVTGKAPLGFRAPHFGCFQSTKQIDFMHSLCRELGYIYASTTMPAIGTERGPFFKNKSVLELPLSGSWQEPNNIPDSWSQLTDRINFTLGNRFYDLWADSLAEVATRKLPMLLAWYVDPAHVINQPSFEHAIQAIIQSGIRSVSGTECVKILSTK